MRVRYFKFYVLSTINEKVIEVADLLQLYCGVKSNVKMKEHVTLTHRKLYIYIYIYIYI